MKVIIFAVSLAVNIVFAQNADFRLSKWGDSKSDVRKVEKSPFHHDFDHELAYFSSEIPDIDGGIKYIFEDNKLTKGIFVSRNVHSNAIDAYNDYLTIQSFYDTTLHKHIKEDWQWSDETFKENPDKLKDALSNGHVKVISFWEFENTKIELILQKRKGRVYSRAFFTPLREIKDQ